MIFVDTGAFLARHVSHDQFHAKARRASFALIRRHELSRAFGFDRHFAAAGFTVWP